MKEYKVEFDAMNYDCVDFYKINSFDELIIIVKEELDSMGGGHADIFDEDDNFIEDVEI